MMKKFNDCMWEEMRSNFVTVKDLSEMNQVASTVLREVFSTVMRTQRAERASPAVVGGCHKLASIVEGNDMESSMVDHTSLQEPNKAVDVSPETINWEKEPVHEVVIYSWAEPSGLGALQKRTKSAMGKLPYPGRHDRSTDMRWFQEPFACGAVRWAFHAQVKNCLQNGHRAPDWSAFVLKRFMGKVSSDLVLHSRRRYCNAVEESSIAGYLADQWNQRQPAASKTIQFLPAYVMEMKTKGKAEYFCCEQKLPPGEFKKYSNNGGMWDLDIVCKELLDFCKYTFDATGGYMMVTDLQGVYSEEDRCFWLTDPAVLCKDTDRFSATNLGPKGLVANVETVRMLLEDYR